jgi:hypothetical protein
VRNITNSANYSIQVVKVNELCKDIYTKLSNVSIITCIGMTNRVFVIPAVALREIIELTAEDGGGAMLNR